MTMDARKQRVLQAIVALYGLEGEPVGSSVLANYFDMAVSSATLRNEMAALTKLGLLEQPHTSAGRVPSAKGYRYYLDNLLTDDQPLDRVTRARVEAVFASLDHEPEIIDLKFSTYINSFGWFIKYQNPWITRHPFCKNYLLLVSSTQQFCLLFQTRNLNLQLFYISVRIFFRFFFTYQSPSG